MKPQKLYIGLMSGTSADGINAALVDFNPSTPLLVGTHYAPYTSSLRDDIHTLSHSSASGIHELCLLDRMLGQAFASTTQELLKKYRLSPTDIVAIGSHGQTIRHHPQLPNAYTLQIGDPNTIAIETNITTVADFRRKDIALGGQGAPLVPTFHQAIFAKEDHVRVIVNIGGIANITLLSPQHPLLGFDTGPGNALLDSWINHHQQHSFDDSGKWAAQGTVHQSLLKQLLSDAYFQQTPPKSTGRDYFNLTWLKKYLRLLPNKIKPVDVQATLVELTARTILNSIQAQTTHGEILICGGGVHNQCLMSRLQTLAPNEFSVYSTARYGIEPDWIEAMAFAWLARQTIMKKPGNHPNVTGAKKAVILGGIYEV